MKKYRYTVSQIIEVLEEVDTGMQVEEICLQHDISSATYYSRKFKSGGIKPFKELEEKNAKLKMMFVDVSLKNNAIKELVAKKGWWHQRNGSATVSELMRD